MKKPIALFTLLLVKTVTAQPILWTGDMTLFGTTQNEHHPCLSAVAGDIVHAFCITEPDTLAVKRSQNNGAGWSDADKIAAPISSPLLATAADASFTFLFVWSENSSLKRLHRFPSSGENWNDAFVLDIATERTTNVVSVSTVTDVLIEPVDSYLNLVWAEKSAGGDVTTVFVQSRDHGTSFLPAIVANSAPAPQEMPSPVSIAVTWNGDMETLHIAQPVDRPGSMPEEIRVFSSTDEGEHWSTGLIIDSSGYPQREPSLAAFGNTLLLVYSRRTDVTLQQDIFFTYSPDGGQNFSPSTPVTGSIADEFNPRVVVDNSGNQFYIFYLMADAQGESATLMVESGSMDTPWDISPPSLVSDTLAALRSGGTSFTVNSSGVAAAWTSPFDLGDTDIHFDASWRSASNSSPPKIIPAQLGMNNVFPNPSNGSVGVFISVNREQYLDLRLTNVLGRSVGGVYSGTLAVGRHLLSLNLSEYPSGTYYLCPAGPRSLPQRIILVR